jgi:excisionase family DNA binding protein
VSDLGLLTTKEAAEMLRLSESALNKLRYEGQIPFVRLGKKVFFTREQLEKYVDSQQFVYTQKETK